MRLSYTQLFPLACTPGTEAEQDFFNLLNNVSSWGEVGAWSFIKSKVHEKFNFQDEKEQVLVSLVLLFCPDMLDLVERPKVEKMNIFYLKAQ